MDTSRGERIEQAVGRAAPLLVVVAAVAPWLPLWNVLPWGADSTRWIGNGALDRPWWTWVFASKHFVGYRPVTALTFVANHAVTGYAPWGYRLTDLVLHAAGMVAFLAVARRWLPAGRGAPWALLAVAYVLLHPVLEEVVPYPSRRSYLLATLFGMVTLLAHERAVQAADPLPRLRWASAAGATFAIAALSNEVAYVLLPLLLLAPLVERGTRELRATLEAAAPAVLLSAFAIAARFVVLGRAGGYQKLFFAQVRDHLPVWVVMDHWEPLRIARALGTYLFVPHASTGAGPTFPQGPPQDLVAAAFAGWLLAVGVVEPLLRFGEVQVRRRLVLAAWVFGAAGIVILSQTWFWRQAHSLVFPIGILVALVVEEAVRERRRSAIAGAIGAVAMVAVAAPWGAVAGVRLGPHAAALEGTFAIDAVESADLPDEPTVVWLALPFPSQGGHITRIWLDRRQRSSGRPPRDYRLLAWYGGARADARLQETTDPDGRAAVTFPSPWELADLTRLDRVFRKRRLPIDALWQPRAGGRTWFYGIDGAHHLVSLEATRPTDGVVVGAERRKKEEDQADDEP